MEETKPGWVTVYTLSLRGCHQTPPPPAINLQEGAEAVKDANLFITDSDALWTALIKAYPGALTLGGDACPADSSRSACQNALACMCYWSTPPGKKSHGHCNQVFGYTAYTYIYLCWGWGLTYKTIYTDMLQRTQMQMQCN